MLDDDSHHGEGAERIHVRVAASEVLVHVLRGCGLGHGSSIVTRGCPESLWLSRGGEPPMGSGVSPSNTIHRCPLRWVPDEHPRPGEGTRPSMSVTFEVIESGSTTTADTEGHRPAVSVILPVYNAAEDIESAISKLEEVTLRDDLEIIVVDDGSTDDTLGRLRAVQTDLHVKVLALAANGGVARARNIAITRATGDYVWMIDADDDWTSDGLERMLAAAKAYDAEIVIARATKLVLSSGERLPVSCPKPGAYNREQAVELILKGDLKGHLWNKLFRRSLLVADQFPPLRTKSDYFGVINAVASATKVAVLADDVYTYKYRLGSITNRSISTPMDLLRCGERALAVAESVLPGGPKPVDVSKFLYGAIFQIALAETWRFGSKAVSGELVQAYARGVISLPGILQLAKAKHLREASFGAAVKFAPSVVKKLYVARRAKRWT
ncbi:glycosyltransferase family 2 protein [Pseudoclavibacter helvolus]|uniref:glycosyltransferase family 2 protein n=1 Tax=Pseudoclavibacter helvolus TaxID=255205 RepID=UPI0024AE0906|nr:glycosyltransferase family 2 protein [Pseudoclavibacter helvolus]